MKNFLAKFDYRGHFMKNIVTKFNYRWSYDEFLNKIESSYGSL